jgi:hypothetical protein
MSFNDLLVRNGFVPYLLPYLRQRRFKNQPNSRERRPLIASFPAFTGHLFLCGRLGTFSQQSKPVF